MKPIKYLTRIASAILATASFGLAATADITGQNGWGQYGGSYGGSVTTITATTDQHASGNASLVFDVPDGSGLTYPVAGFAATTGGTLTVSMKMYFPSTSQGAFLFGFDDGVGGYYGGWYVSDSSGDWRDRWVTMKFVVDLDNPNPGNGTYYFDDMVTPAGTFDYTSNTINNLWFLVGNSFNGTPVTGPFYFDDMAVEQNSTVVWSDNFDSYIPNEDPNLISIDVIANGSIAVSGDVVGSPFTGQNGLWNALSLDAGGTISLSTLTNGAGAEASGVGFVFDSTGAGYHLQPGDAPYDPGVVLSADNPERAWVTGGESPVTFKFTGLTASAPYSLAIYTTGDTLMTLTVNGTDTLDPGMLFTTATTANSSGEIVCQVSCGGDTYANYGEIAGFQLLKLAAPPALAAHAGADKALSPGTPSAVLGATPAASGGTGPYTYLWSPDTGLDDATLENPTVTTTDATTTYTLTVTDSLLATASDEVVVTYTVPPLVADAGADQVYTSGTPVTLGGSPAASGGSGTYFYSWSPSDDGSLSSSTEANPTAAPTATTTYTLTVTDDLGTTPATDSVTVTYVTPPAPNANLISVDYIQSGGTPCSGDTTLTGTTMKNAVGNSFSGQSGSWNGLNIGTYNQSSAISGFLNNGAGTATTVKLALGRATGLDNTAAGGWRCSPNEGASGGPQQLRSESAYLYNGVITGDHYAWALTGLTPNGAYKLVWFGDLGNAGGASNMANSVAGTRDSEGDWNWDSVTADGSGIILGTFTAPNPTLGLFGLQIESIGSGAAGYDTWATANAGGQAADLDYDHDGMSNGVEYFMGQTGSSFTPNPGVVAGTVTWPRDPAATAPFKVQVSDDLTTWTDVVPPDPSIDETNPNQVTYTLPAGAAKKFCRLVVTP